MKINHILALVALFVPAFTLGAFAQDPDTATFERDVRIEREYVPDIEPTKRPTIENNVQDYTVTQADIIYSTYASSVQPESQFYPLHHQQQNILARTAAPRGYAELGVGIPLNWRGELFYPIFKPGGNTQLNVALDHNGIWTKSWTSSFDKESRPTIENLDTRFAVDFSQIFDGQHQLFAVAQYENNFYNYYASDDIQRNESVLYQVRELAVRGDSLLNPLQCLHRAGATVGMRSVKPLNGCSYEAAVSYNMLYMQYLALSEHDITARAKVDRQFGKDMLDLKIALYANIYNRADRAERTDLQENVIIELRPGYTFHWKDIDLRLGVNFWASCLKNGPKVAASPDVHFNYAPINWLAIYAGVTGSYQSNTLSNTLRLCRYYDPESEPDRNTWLPADFYLGLKFRPFEGLLIDVWGRYYFAYNDVMFKVKGFEEAPASDASVGSKVRSNLFEAYLLNYQGLKPGARITYNYKDRYTAYAAFEYGSGIFDQETKDLGLAFLFHRPKYKLWTGVEARPLDELVVKADFYMGYLYATAGANNEFLLMNNIYDLNLSASYTLQKRFSIFVEANNLLSFAPTLRYQRWYGYDNIGFNMLVGLKVAF